MFWFKKKKQPEVKIELPTEEELAISTLLNKLQLFDLQKMLKDCQGIMGQKDLEQMEFILNLIKPELEKRLKAGFTGGSIKKLELDWEKYRIPVNLAEALGAKHGLFFDIFTNEKYHYVGCNRVIDKEADSLSISFNLTKVKK